MNLDSMQSSSISKKHTHAHMKSSEMSEMLSHTHTSSRFLSFPSSFPSVFPRWLAEIHCLMSIRIGDVDLDSVMSCDPSSSPVVGSTAALPPSDHCPTFIVTITPLLDPRPPPLTKNTNGNANNTE